MAGVGLLSNFATSLLAEAFGWTLSRTRKLILAVILLLAIVGVCVALQYDRKDICIALFIGVAIAPLPLAQRQVNAPAYPVITMGAADLAWQTFADGAEAWAFGVSFTFDPAGKGHGLLIIGAECRAQISTPKGSNDGPLYVTLCNVQNNDGPPLPTARIDDDAATLTFVCRHLEAPWLVPLPSKVLVEVIVTGAGQRQICLPPTLLIQSDPAVPHWTGHGAATATEIAEFK